MRQCIYFDRDNGDHISHDGGTSSDENGSGGGMTFGSGDGMTFGSAGMAFGSGDPPLSPTTGIFLSILIFVTVEMITRNCAVLPVELL